MKESLLVFIAGDGWSLCLISPLNTMACPSCIWYVSVTHRHFLRSFLLSYILDICDTEHVRVSLDARRKELVEVRLLWCLFFLMRACGDRHPFPHILLLSCDRWWKILDKVDWRRERFYSHWINRNHATSLTDWSLVQFFLTIYRFVSPLQSTEKQTIDRNEENKSQKDIQKSRSVLAVIELHWIWLGKSNGDAACWSKAEWVGTAEKLGLPDRNDEVSDALDVVWNVCWLPNA